MGNTTDSDSTSTIDYSIIYTTANWDTTSSGTVRYCAPRKFYVKIPKHWKRSQIDGFAGLVNEETDTGWKVTALVKLVKLYDKSVEIISMTKFMAIMLKTAKASDADKIVAFFEKN